ncbi:33902_t:CDS:2 [Gigaspora margarita]|uniref:33902_t:CDS:1 n=1 Tax=Gigaspora margarita TaxID=4874 RepID=A0ABM8W4J5_GIGMA|nr:33902_t:CDS:2 [Gigaspora margarita]
MITNITSNNVEKYVSASTQTRHRRQEKRFQDIPITTLSINVQHLNNNNAQSNASLEIANYTFNSLPLQLLNSSSTVFNLSKKNELELDSYEENINEQSSIIAISNDLENNESEYELENLDSELEEESNYSENESSDIVCSNCGEPRYISSKKARKSAAYFSVIDSLQIQYKDPLRAKVLCYRNEYTSREEYLSENSQFGDIFDANQYKSSVKSGLFLDPCDVALTASTDGYQLFKKKQNDCWVILLLNANLLLFLRVKKENLMIVAIIPGPKSPKNFNSFLQPLIEELKCLEVGVPCYDALLQKTFILHSHILSWSGDIPAISKIILACIFSTFTTKGYNSTIYDLNNLPICSHTSYNQDVNMLENKTLFPIDIMHALFENTAKHMFRHYIGKFYNEELNNSIYKVSSNSWNEIGKIKELNRKMMPSEFGRPPINIHKYYTAFKAKDWYNWTVLYLLPLFRDIFQKNGWAKFVKATKLCLELVISREQLKEIKILFTNFINYYKR